MVAKEHSYSCAYLDGNQLQRSIALCESFYRNSFMHDPNLVTNCIFTTIPRELPLCQWVCATSARTFVQPKMSHSMPSKLLPPQR